MKKDITTDLEKMENAKVVVPSLSTLNFIKQFARAYYSDEKAEKLFKNVILN